MQTKKLLLVVSFLASTLLRAHYSLAQQPEDPMPPAATAVLNQFEKDVDIARTKAIVALEKVLKDTTKKGDLAGAMAVKEAVDQLKADARGRVAGKPVANRVGRNAFVGRWMEGQNPADLQADGTVIGSAGLTGQWTWDGRTVEITWSNGIIYRLQVELDDLVGAVITAGKESSRMRWTRPK